MHFNLGVFGQKAWTIAHGFDQFWVIFTLFEFSSFYKKTCIFGRFWPKSMDYSPWF
jgi:hypothetical protein